MGRAPATIAQVTRVHAWAETTLFLGGGQKKQYRRFFAKPGSEDAPTTFYSCLAKGWPTPRLRLQDGSEGPALAIESEVPGSLKWLIHPLWTTFDSPCESIFEVHRLMAALEPAVTDRLFEPASLCLRRRGRALIPFCDELFHVGTLDALAAVMYCGYEALLAHDLAVARAVERTLRRRLFDWQCVAHLSERTKRSLHVLCENAIDASSLCPARKDDAPWAVATDVLARRIRTIDQTVIGSLEDVAFIERLLKTP